MKTRIIIAAIVITVAIWFVIGGAMEFIGWNDYGFIRAMMIVFAWYFAIELIKIIKRDEE